MKAILLLPLLVVAIFACEASADDEFEKFKVFLKILFLIGSEVMQKNSFSLFLQISFNKKYSPDEEPMRREIFLRNLKLIENHNERHSFRLAINEFADLVSFLSVFLLRL